MMWSAIARDEVALGDGTLPTLTTRPLQVIRKSSTSRPWGVGRLRSPSDAC